MFNFVGTGIRGGSRPNHRTPPSGRSGDPPRQPEVRWFSAKTEPVIVGYHVACRVAERARSMRGKNLTWANPLPRGLAATDDELVSFSMDPDYI